MKKTKKRKTMIDLHSKDLTRTVGYAKIKNEPLLAESEISLDNFIGKTVRILVFVEPNCFHKENEVIVISNDVRGKAVIKMSQVESSFRCDFYGPCLLPPDLTFEQKMIYY